MRDHHNTCRMLALASIGLLLAGCGGSSSDISTDGEQYSLKTTSITTQAMPEEAKRPLGQTVQLEGCVVDTLWLGAAGVAINVRSADGRAVGSAYTDTRGVFTLKVPARSALVVSMDWAGPPALTLQTGTEPLSLGACLPSAS